MTSSTGQVGLTRSDRTNTWTTGFCLLVMNFTCLNCIFCFVGLFPSHRRALFLGSEPCVPSSDSSRSCILFTADLIPSVSPKFIHLFKQKLLLSPPLVEYSIKMLFLRAESVPRDVQQKPAEVQADVRGNSKILICWIFIGRCLNADGFSHWVTI